MRVEYLPKQESDYTGSHPQSVLRILFEDNAPLTLVYDLYVHEFLRSMAKYRPRVVSLEQEGQTLICKLLPTGGKTTKRLDGILRNMGLSMQNFLWAVADQIRSDTIDFQPELWPRDPQTGLMTKQLIPDMMLYLLNLRFGAWRSLADLKLEVIYHFFPTLRNTSFQQFLRYASSENFVIGESTLDLILATARE